MSDSHCQIEAMGLGDKKARLRCVSSGPFVSCNIRKPSVNRMHDFGGFDSRDAWGSRMTAALIGTLTFVVARDGLIIRRPRSILFWICWSVDSNDRGSQCGGNLERSRVPRNDKSGSADNGNEIYERHTLGNVRCAMRGFGCFERSVIVPNPPVNNRRKGMLFAKVTRNHPKTFSRPLFIWPTGAWDQQCKRFSLPDSKLAPDR
jgi:hypothetical protein